MLRSKISQPKRSYKYARTANDQPMFAAAKNVSKRNRPRLSTSLATSSTHLDFYDSCVASLRECRARRTLARGKIVHRLIDQAGLHRKPQLANLLLQMYAKCGDLRSAQSLFDAIQERSTLAWSLLIAAYAHNGHTTTALSLFDAMHARDGLVPTDFAISTALSACSALGDLDRGARIHRWAEELGYGTSPIVHSALVSLYAKCRRFPEAMALFRAIPQPGAVVWNALISALAQSERFRDALGLYHEMLAAAVEPSIVSFAVALSASASLGAGDEGREIHARIMLSGFHGSTIAQNGLVTMYAKCGFLDQAREIFDAIAQRSVVSWSAMIAAYALHGRGRDALALFHAMDVQPNAITLTAALNACAVADDLDQGRAIHQLADELESNAILENAVLNMYARCGSLDEARRVFYELGRRDVFSWTTMITACAENSELVEAIQLFQRMDLEGVAATGVTLASVLNACACSGALRVGRRIHARVDACGFQASVLVQTALLDMYAKCGSLESSGNVFASMAARNSVSWTAMIAALAQHGLGDEALELFKEMNLEGWRADATTFICVLRACSHAGLLKESREFFQSMIEDYAIAPTETHYCRALDIMGRAGRLHDAEELIHSMPFYPEALTWKTLLNACRIHSQADRATRVAEHIAKLQPEDSTAYTLLGHVYAATGRSYIEVKSKVHEFTAGDQTHPCKDQIALELEKLSKQMKEAGYVPNTKDVLHDVGEEEKEQLIGLHSEKVAIAFGLLATPPGTSLLLVKNLRVCSDCHAATKVISKISNRRIVVRDTHRFHHFENGQCSCKDYW